MTTITTRSGKGSPLTNNEVDANFTNLNDDKVETSGDSMTGNLSFGDNNKAIFGAGSDLQIYHDGSNSFVTDEGTGDLILRGANVRLSEQSGNENFVYCSANGAVTLYYDNAAKLATTSTGIDVTGVITTDGMTTSADINFGDNDKAVFGAGSDLQIYHDGSNSYISDQGTNDLKVLATDFQLKNAADSEFMMTAVTDGAVTAYHNGSARLATTATGIDVTGSAVIDGLTSAGDAAITGSSSGSTVLTLTSNALADTPLMVFQRAGGAVAGKLAYEDSNTAMSFGTTTAHEFKFLTSNTERMQITSAGLVGIGTNSPAATLHTVANSGTTALLTVGASGNNIASFYTSGSSQVMTLDVSGNLLVGKTSASFTTAGLELRNGGPAIFGRAQAEPLILNRLTTDGGIVNFNKDGTTVGSIGTNGGALYISSPYGTDSGLKFASSIVAPSTTTGANRDAAIDLGYSSSRFKDLYLSGFTRYNSEVYVGDGASISGSYSANDLLLHTDNNPIVIRPNGSEAARFDSSGNLLVGKTSTGAATAGIELNGASDILRVARDGGAPLELNRITSDGTIVDFRKDNTTVGSIQSRAGAVTTIVLDPRSNGAGISGSSNAILPTNEAGNPQNNLVSVGTSTNNFKDLYLSGVAYIAGTTGRGLKISNATESYTNNVAVLDAQHSQGILQFKTAGSEAARIDKDGNFLVGTTNTLPAINNVEGIALSTGSFGGRLEVSRDSGEPVSINRKTDDGNLMSFKKDGTTVGSIGTQSGNPYIGGTNRGIRFDSTQIIPADMTASGSNSDNSIDIGDSGVRFKDLYLSGRVAAGAGSIGTPTFHCEGDTNTGINLPESDRIQFVTGGAERARFDASGNFLVGTTTSAPQNFSSGSGTQISDGYIAAARGGAVALLNRVSTDGDIVEFKKDGTTVGSIGTVGGDLIVGTGDVALAFNDFVDAIYPVNTSGANRDNAVDLGDSAIRFDDIYATNGTIQTSDRNEKQDIEELSDAEQRVAVACKGLLRKFRWKSSVTENGDDARIHFGIIAQDLQAAFEAEGLDAGRYAMFISTTWTDEETGEERTRMGVRYSELLAFIIAAI